MLMLPGEPGFITSAEYNHRSYHVKVGVGVGGGGVPSENFRMTKIFVRIFPIQIKLFAI